MSFIFNNGLGSTLDMSFASISGSACVYHAKELLKLAGWTHDASSDGTNVSNTVGNANDQITTTAEMGTNNAWFVLFRPAIARGIGYPGNDGLIFRRGTSDTSWAVFYIPPNTDGSKQAKTANGTTSAVPTYTTTVVVKGTLPDTPQTWWGNSSANQRYHIGADSAAPYGFYIIRTLTDGQTGGGWFLFDCVQPSSMDPADTSGVVISSASGTATTLHANGCICRYSAADNASGPLGYFRYGLTGSIWTQMPALAFCNHNGTGFVNVVPAGVVGQYSSRELPLPFFYGIGDGSARTSGAQNNGQPSGIKGKSYMLGWRAGAQPTGWMLKRKTAGDRAVFGDITVPWDGSTQVTWT